MIQKFLKSVLIIALFIISAHIYASPILSGEEYLNKVKSLRPSKNIETLLEDPKNGTGFVEVRGEVINIFELGEDRYFTLQLSDTKKYGPLDFIYINIPEDTESDVIENQKIACILKWDLLTINQNITQMVQLNKDEHYDIEFFSFLPAVTAYEEENAVSAGNVHQFGKPADFVMPEALRTQEEKSEMPATQNYGADSPGKMKICSIIRSVNGDLSDNLTYAYADFIIAYSIGQGVDPLLTCALITQESRFRSSATSRAGAQGLGQLMPYTAKGLGINNPYDPQQNIFATAKYLKNVSKNLFGKYTKDLNLSQLKLVLASYNAGPNAVKKYNGIPPYSETQNYVTKVLNYYMKYLSL